MLLGLVSAAYTGLVMRLMISIGFLLFWNNATSKTVNSVKQIHAIIDGKVVVISESSVRNDLSLMMRMVTALPQTSVPLDHGADEEIGSGDRPKRQDTTLGGADAQTRPETASKMSHDPPPFKFNTSRRGENSMEYHDDLTDFVPPTPHDSPLLGGNTPRSNEGRMELIQELMETCISLTKRVLSLEEAKTAQDRVITRLKLRVNRLEKKRKARTPQPIKRRLFKGRVETSTDKSLGEDASKQERNDDKTEELNLTDGVDTEVIREDKGSGERGGSTADQVSTVRLEVSAASVPVNVSAATPSTTPPIIITIFGDEDLTIAQTLVKMRRDKAKEKEKGVVLINEEEPPRLNRSTTTLQPLLTIDPKDKELAQRLHEEEFAELDRAQKERQKQEEATSVALAEEFDEIQARTDADHELAVRLTHEEQEKYTIKERARLLVEFFKRRKKQLAAERAEAIRNKPPIRTQVRNRMITYLKHMDDDSQQQAESTKKRPRAYSEEESSKKQKLEEDNDAKNRSLEIVWIAYGSSKNYKIFSEMLDDFDKQDVIDLHRLVNERYEITSPEGYDLLLWGDLKTLFEPNEEDEIWKNQQDYNLISWRLFDSCRVYVLLMNTGVAIHIMIEKKHPLTQEMLSRMLNRRLEIDYESEMAFELLKFTRSQLQK
ncbi:hypothetical protein Tco_1277681 [Tanacetum coccineum]